MRSPASSRWAILPILSLAACSLSTSDFTFDAGQAGSSSGGSVGAGGAGQAGQQAGGAGQAGQPAGGAGQAGQPAAGAGQAGQPAGGAGQAGQPAAGAGQAGQPAGGAGQAGAAPCAASERRCNGADIEVCTGGVFTKETSCAQSCVMSGGAPTCSNCKPDEGKCSGTTLLRCASDGSGYALVNTCSGDAPICDEKGNSGKGECDKCAPDTLQCVGSILFKCSPSGQDLLLSQDCGSASLCDAAAGKCKIEACKAGERSCQGDVPMVCDTVNNKMVPAGAACGPGLCNPASSTCLVCAAGAYRCDSDDLQSCAPDGSKWDTVTACPAGKCDAQAKTCTQCTSGSRICSGQSIIACAGGSFTPGTKVKDCAPAEICDAVAGECDVCQPGTMRCDGAVLKQCSMTGQGESVLATCPTAAQCSRTAGACLACVPGEFRCNGRGLERCADDGGGWVETAQCATAALCDATTQVCRAPTCDPGEITCAAGNQRGTCNADQTGFDYKACGASTACVPGSDCAFPTGITAGLAHACATLKGAGAVVCWGNNGLGQCGNAAVGTMPPTTVKADTKGNLLFDIESVAAGYSHTCALSSKGTVYCWGYNSNGQLGSGAAGGSQAIPVLVPLRTGATRIAAGGDSTCAVLSDTSTWCWGRNDRGQLGVGDTSDHTSPVELTKLSGAPISLSLSGKTSCAITVNFAGNTVLCWGDNTYGQAGEAPSTSPVLTPRSKNLFGADEVVTAADGSSSAVTCVRSGASVQCWGSNGAGEQGNGSTGAPTSDPDKAVSLPFDATRIASNYPCSCAALTKSTVCWGSCPSPELAGQISGTSFPTPMTIGTGQVFTQLAVGQNWACGLRAGGEIACWGRNNLLQLGSPGPTVTTPRPVVFP